MPPKTKKPGRIKRFRLEFKTQLKIALMAAFGFLIALSWRDFITEAVSYLITYLKLSGDLYVYKLISAIIITIIAVIGILILSKFNSEDKK